MRGYAAAKAPAIVAVASRATAGQSAYPAPARCSLRKFGPRRRQVQLVAVPLPNGNTAAPGCRRNGKKTLEDTAKHLQGMRSKILNDEVWNKGTKSAQKIWTSLGHGYHPGHLVILLLCAFQFHANISSGLPLDINSLLENLSTVVHVWIFWSCGPILKHFTGNTTTLLAMVSGVLTCAIVSSGSLSSGWRPIGTILASSLIGALAVVASTVSSLKLIVVGRQMAMQRIRECAFCLAMLGTQPYTDLLGCVGGFMGGFLVSSLIVKSSVICRFKCTFGELSLMRKARKLKDERKKLQVIGAKIVESDDNEEDIDDQASLVLQRLSLIDIKRSFVNGCYTQQVR